MMIRYLIILCFVCVSCAPSAEDTPNISVVTAIPNVKSVPTISSLEIPFIETDNCDVSDDMLELPAYIPSDLEWVTVNGSQLAINDVQHKIYGVNYYPRISPFEHFLTDSDTETIAEELDIIAPSGINTLRIFLSFEQLFLCETKASPAIERFTLLDEIIQTIASRNFHIIVVLHRQINDVQQIASEQLQFVVNRYANEPAILAWDVLDKGDTLYVSYSSEAVLTWLANAILAIRQVGTQHLITTSWETQAIDTVELVDLVSFQHFGDYLPLRQEIANLKAGTDKPILLSAIGYSTFDLDETAQRNLLYQAFEEARFNDLVGWNIYSAFDYPTSVTCIEPGCPAKPKSLNHFGIWNTSYFPKLAVDAVKRVTESE
jgi:hypothetical protein